VSRELARAGANVIVIARDAQAVEAAVDALEGEGHTPISLDVSDAAAWPAAISTVGRLHGLVCAAGVLGPIGALDEVDPKAVATTIQINLLGTVLALHHALPLLRASGGRAVTFSGGGATSPLPRYDAYAVSKAGVARLTENVAASAGVEVNCVAPGFVATRMHEGTLAAGREAAGAGYFEQTRVRLSEGGFPASEAAALVRFLLSDAASGISGRLLSAQWDPWREEALRAGLRADPALATLRRIDDQFFTACDV
jgi:NAD(P)-dependent dehydrogenase (short-subunit alcohol dehydrogenase family)